MSAPDVVLEGVSAWVGKRQVLTEVSLACRGGEITVILGAAEASKTSLLRVINRLLEETPGFRREGRVAVGGLEVGEVGVQALRRLVGMIFDQPAPFPMSVYDNVAFVLRMGGISGSELDDRVEAALREAGLWETLEGGLSQPASSLAAGEQQLLCLARTVALGPQVLLLDEPTAALNPAERSALEEVVLSQRGRRTVLLATRSVGEAGRLGDTTAFLERGTLVEVAPTADLFTLPRHPSTQAYLSRRYRS